MKKFLFFGFFVLLFVGLQAQDPFAGLSGRSRTRPNMFAVDQHSVKIRYTLDDRTSQFTLSKSNMFDFVYDSVSPMGRLMLIDFSTMPFDSAAIYRLAEIYVRGKHDAQRNYTMYTPPAVTTLVLSAIPLAGPVLGAAFAIPASLTPVEVQNLGHPPAPLVDHRLYYLGYTEEARRIKARRIWLNFGIGLGVCLGWVFLHEATDGGAGLPWEPLFK